MNQNPPPTSESELGSCSKKKQWSELARTAEDETSDRLWTTENNKKENQEVFTDYYGDK